MITLAPDTRTPLRTHPIWHDRLQCVVAPDHPLAALRAVALDDVVAHPAVLPDPGPVTHRSVAGLFAERGLVPSLRMTTQLILRRSKCWCQWDWRGACCPSA